ncbi:hypothetical protein LTS17_002808 [Exophiala oligosperma]
MAQHATAAPPEWLTANEHRSNLVSTPGKRKADDELESQSNISSHFKKLRLNQNHTSKQSIPGQPLSPSQSGLSFRPHIANTDARPALPVPVDESHYTSQFNDQYPSSPHPMSESKYGENTLDGQHQPYSHFANTQKPPSLSDSAFMTDRSPPHQTILNDRQREEEEEESMTVDETPNRIFITNLASEIAQIEADEAASKYSVFLPDIDKKVSALPAHLLNTYHDSSRLSSVSPTMASPSTALVLYRDPTSITVPEEEDAVRKAIIAARRRAREKSAEDERDRERRERLHMGGGDGDIDLDDDAMTDHSSHRDREEEDLDAMDIE